MKFTVAMLQIAPLGQDQNGNLAKGLESCRRAKDLGADLIVFPELWSIGGAAARSGEEGRRIWVESAVDGGSTFLHAFRGLSRELNLNIAVTYLEKHSPLLRNTVSIIDGRGEIALSYSKVFICNFGIDSLSEANAGEIGCDIYCSPGESFDVCTLKGGEGEVRVGAMICADREFPEAATQLMLNGAELIVVPNACEWDEIRTAGLKTRAFENLAGIAMANYPLPRNNGRSQAHTYVAWRDGRACDTLIACAGEGEETLLATFNINEIRAFREAESWRMNYRRSGAANSLERHSPPRKPRAG